MFSFHHVALSVSNLEESVAFYSLLGFDPVFDWQAEDDSLSIVHLRQGEALLELFCFTTPVAAPESTRSLATDLPRIGIKHFGVKVADIAKAKDEIEKLGIIDKVEVVKGRTGIDYFFITDPSGILVEVVQDDREL
ncbi:glyoxylase I family protein [Mariprofundus micogutta]|uniref:Glyoxylase I family protein n=1 Tax=Mariprofundus micogutta TaxID=1921010 RepID=A0A1L8CJL1_9PROT|nr:VOC family protein [Mariprofundus micogutta]GAV19103.1 glyoxylase I family protein [Mariprofundus micogutta]